MILRASVLSALLLVGLGAAPKHSVSANDKRMQDNLVSVIEKQTNKKVRILEIKPLKSSQDLKMVVIEDPDTKYNIPLVVSKDGNLIIGLSNIFFSNKSDDVQLVAETNQKVQALNATQQNSAKLNAIFNEIPADYAIELPSTNAKNKDKILYIVSDPMCPHCQKELTKLRDHLKENTVRMVVVGWLGVNSAKKAALIQEEMAKARARGASVEDKISILEKIYSTQYDINAQKEPEDLRTKVENTTKKIFESGVIKGVPFLYHYKA
ncbi:protein disulfide-isomerase DsbK [Helicobacter pylori]|uniref:protein disulfide-isomerase DsbK n=1 Tax=Helicobacter pylori TaxID=210 RepID=UPI001922A204|nr:protein disulfide-isomerase DsbK [Helicobacter pylori]QQW78833.1 protein disulfide-isomerase DsbK [Helicobacter pylori]WRE06939.1 protein disulfide-isomerase DsbK [Helicobacter pylori]GHQ38998.1 protein disulfide-isomerase [Helicobacter pylori]GHR43924.1 protein disulfide-isomerase [Helicobacter pylori]GHR82221.1 protein disulfide-isomerase [Helicobacter pylori]